MRCQRQKQCIATDRLDRDAGRDRQAASTPPIAMGERLSSIWEFEELLSRNVAIQVRPDVGLAGGLSGCRKIAAIAEAHHCGVAPHNFLGPGLTAASTLQLCATIPNLGDDGVLCPTTRTRATLVGRVRGRPSSSATAATARCPPNPASASPSSTTTDDRAGRRPSLLKRDGGRGQMARSQQPSERPPPAGACRAWRVGSVAARRPAPEQNSAKRVAGQRRNDGVHVGPQRQAR